MPLVREYATWDSIEGTHVFTFGTEVMLYTLSSKFQSHVISMAGNFNKAAHKQFPSLGEG